MTDNSPFEPQSNGEVYHPSADFLSKLNVSSGEQKEIRTDEDLTAYWSERARELEWYQPWNKVLEESNKPFYKWFVDGKVNIVHNCLDRYVKTWRRNKLALIWEGEPGDCYCNARLR